MCTCSILHLFSFPPWSFSDNFLPLFWLLEPFQSQHRVLDLIFCIFSSVFCQEITNKKQEPNVESLWTSISNSVECGHKIDGYFLLIFASDFPSKTNPTTLAKVKLSSNTKKCSTISLYCRIKADTRENSTKKNLRDVWKFTLQHSNRMRNAKYSGHTRNCSTVHSSLAAHTIPK